MKLPKSYYDDINTAISVRQMPSTSFSFTKKKGWIYINHLASGHYFSFFRKKSVEISTLNHQWEDKETFRTKLYGGAVEEKSNWQDVMDSFREWLEGIQ